MRTVQEILDVYCPQEVYILMEGPIGSLGGRLEFGGTVYPERVSSIIEETKLIYRMCESFTDPRNLYTSDSDNRFSEENLFIQDVEGDLSILTFIFYRSDNSIKKRSMQLGESHNFLDVVLKAIKVFEQLQNVK